MPSARFVEAESMLADSMRKMPNASFELGAASCQMRRSGVDAKDAKCELRNASCEMRRSGVDACGVDAKDAKCELRDAS